MKKWIEKATEQKVTDLEIRSMVGGISADIYQLGDFVMKCYSDKEWLLEEPDLVKHEVESLRYAKKAGLPVPKLIDFDEVGTVCGNPAILMSRLAGSPILLPDDPRRYVDGLATALSKIHQLKAEDFEWNYFSYTEITEMKIPKWTKNPVLWERAINLASQPEPSVPIVFIHRDYHPANVLWQENQVSGIVDWVNACRGPAGIDIGHCRINLSLLHGVEMADAFLAAYCREVPTFKYHAYFDIISIFDFIEGPLTVYPGWLNLGVEGLTDKLMEERMDTLMESIMIKLKE